MTIYDKKYALAWIENHESRRDSFRVKYLEPYLKGIIKKNLKAQILDIGCGWGTIADFVEKQEYLGIDINKHFFSYILLKNKNKKITLRKDQLPNINSVKNNKFDLVICSMVLHTTLNLKKAIKQIFSKLKDNGQVVIVDFNNDSEQKIREGFFKKLKNTDKYSSGIYKLESGTQLKAEVYFHKEEEIEKEIVKYSKFKKKKLGPIFFSWECIRK